MSGETEVTPGRYRHYKGREYSVVGTARHSETLDELVVYRPEYGERGLWVRPRAMFSEQVTVDGCVVPRFQRLTAGAEEPIANADNLLGLVPSALPTEVIQTLVQSHDVRIERIISQGHASPPDFWYEQPDHEWVVLLQGAARLAFEDRTIALSVGDFINIPAHTRHRVDWTTSDVPTIWLAVHYGKDN